MGSVSPGLFHVYLDVQSSTHLTGPYQYPKGKTPRKDDRRRRSSRVPELDFLVCKAFLYLPLYLLLRPLGPFSTFSTLCAIPIIGTWSFSDTCPLRTEQGSNWTDLHTCSLSPAKVKLTNQVAGFLGDRDAGRGAQALTQQHSRIHDYSIRSI